MKLPSLASCTPVLAGWLACIAPSWTHAQQPVADMYSLMKNFTVYPVNANDPALGGMFALTAFHAAFLPKDSLYTGAAGYDYPYHIVMRNGAGEALETWKLAGEADEAVFSRIRHHGAFPQFVFADAGEYILSVQHRDQAMTDLPFTITIEDSGDPFAPARETYVDGPWKSWACLVMRETGHPEEVPIFHHYVRGGRFNQNDSDKWEMEIRHEGDIVFIGSTTSTSKLSNQSNWVGTNTQIKFRTGDGGGAIKLKDLLKKDGDYQIVRRRNGEMEAVWAFKVASGKLVPHPRQAFSHKPVTEQLLSRTSDADRTFLDLIWMERLSPERAAEVLNAGPALASGPSPEDLKRWTVAPTGSGPAKLVVTDADCRMDGTLAVGDGVIAFATGGGTGVGFLRVGEDATQTIPDGQNFNGKLIRVTGKKLVLVKGNQVHVFDTTSGQMSAIPEDQVYLSKTYADMYQANPMWSDGNLVAVLNDPKKVTDRAMLKVIDTSGAEPVVLTIVNIDVPVREITSVTVDAETGQVGMASKRLSKIWVGPAVDGGRLKEFDVSGHDGYNNQCHLHMAGGRAVYFDAAGTPKLRVLDLNSGAVTSLGSLAKAESYFDLTASHVAMATNESYGSSYTMAFGAWGSDLKVPANTGESGPGSGKLGMGGSIALTPDGAVLMAGRGKGGIGSDEFLEFSTGGPWSVVAGADGAALTAIDVRQGPGVIAFKTGKRNDTKIAYVLVGQRFDPSGLPVVAQ